jgi:uracil-DNA glycosylase
LARITWAKIIDSERERDYFQKLKQIIDKEYQTHTIYPPKNKIFNAFKLCPFDKTKVVILGQDPYHQPNQAQGLAFSTPENIPNPPSMVNILKEINSSFGDSICESGDLTLWAQQGVLLLNTALTVRHNQANSHQNLGWETFSDNIIKYISDNKANVVFLLWGANAKKKEVLIDKNKHLVLTSAHPSPLSAHRGFFGNNHFIKTNNYLKAYNKQPINW